MTALQTNTTRDVLKYKAAGELRREDDAVCVTEMVFHDASGISKSYTLKRLYAYSYMNAHMQRSARVCVCVLG